MRLKFFFDVKDYILFWNFGFLVERSNGKEYWVIFFGEWMDVLFVWEEGLGEWVYLVIKGWIVVEFMCLVKSFFFLFEYIRLFFLIIFVVRWSYGFEFW